MEYITFRHLDQLSDEQIERLAARMANGRNRAAVHSRRVASLFVALLTVLESEQGRRRTTLLPHSAVPVTVALPTVGELSEGEVRTVMRSLLEARTTLGACTAVAGFCDAALATLEVSQAHQMETLARLACAFDKPPDDTEIRRNL
ncbi:MAG: hypothetical protein ACRDJE_01060 [Dehalococcoidia bacterium]